MQLKHTFLATSAMLAIVGCEDRSIKTLDTADLIKQLDNPNYVIIDSRDDNFYNGFKEPNAKRGGHIKGAIQFSCSWLNYIDGDKFESFAAGKGITKEKTLVIYHTQPEQLNCVAEEFANRGYQVRLFNDYLNYANSNAPLESFPNYHYLVSPQWVNQLIQGEKPETYQNENFMIFEVSWGDVANAKDYANHIKGAYHFNTDWVENDPVWNLSEPAVIEKNLLANGITKDKTIVLYSDNQLAAYRIFWALKWAGVEDVRIMNGTLETWIDEGFPTESTVNTPTAETTFGTVIPTNPHINISTPKEVITRQQQGLKLISNRSWEEFLGNTSGYSYIEGKGEPQGAIWGFAGSDSSNMADYYDPDGTLRNPKEMFALWQGQAIRQGDELAFYCGTGWRAGVSWFITQLAGWENTKVYDGGWNAWQMDNTLPIQTGAVNYAAKPMALNNSGKPQRQGASCKD